MISKFWDELFKYADELKKNGKASELKIVHHVEDILQKVWDDGEKQKTYVMNFEPRSEMEKMILSIPGISVWLDNDGQYFYELDRKHFDQPYEVVEYLIGIRNKKKLELTNAERERISDIAYKELKKRMDLAAMNLYNSLYKKIDALNIDSVFGIVQEVKEMCDVPEQK